MHPEKSSVNTGLAWSAALFIAVLFISAVLDPSIRVLHLFESVPYLVAPWLSRRRPKAGYALAFAGGAFWLWTAGFLTTFIRNGFERIVMLIKTGTVDRPDILLSVPGFIGTLGLVIFSMIGYLRSGNKKWTDILLLVAAVLVTSLFFILIFFAFAPQYLGMFSQVIGK